MAVAAITPAPFLSPLFGTGPTVGRKQNDRIEFAPVDRIEPGQVVIFKVEVQGTQAGDGRMRVEVKSDTSQTPLFTEEAIRIANPAPPPALKPVP